MGPGIDMIREGFTGQVTLGLGLRVCVRVQRQASEGTLQAELHVALSWARQNLLNMLYNANLVEYGSISSSKIKAVSLVKKRLCKTNKT